MVRLSGNPRPVVVSEVQQDTQLIYGWFLFWGRENSELITHDLAWAFQNHNVVQLPLVRAVDADARLLGDILDAMDVLKRAGRYVSKHHEGGMSVADFLRAEHYRWLRWQWLLRKSR